jgi:hypothetical protein
MFGCAALQIPHQLVPNSTTAGPVSGVDFGAFGLLGLVFGSHGVSFLFLYRPRGSSVEPLIASETQAGCRP